MLSQNGFRLSLTKKKKTIFQKIRIICGSRPVSQQNWIRTKKFRIMNTIWLQNELPIGRTYNNKLRKIHINYINKKKRIWFSTKLISNQMKQLSTGVLRLSLRSSSSNGVKFKSKRKFNFWSPSFDDSFKMDNEEEGLPHNKPSLIAVLCFLMCPPKACPIANSSPQIGHGCILGCCFMVGFGNSWWHERSVTMSFGFLWLALWPPRAWKEENLLLQVLHLKSPISLPFDIG